MLRNCGIRHFRSRVVRAVAGLILAVGVSAPTLAQQSTGDCPCFNSEEVERVFRKVGEVAAGGGGGSCQVSDYSVEFTGEIMVMDANYQALAKASVKWADFDPGQCNYRDATASPPVERSIDWPHPAPEATARACLGIISNVIAKLDSDGTCRTYP